MASTYYVNSSFTPTRANPFNQNKPYTNKWVMVKLVENAPYRLHVNTACTGLYTLKINKEQNHWHYSLMDFITYQTAQNQSIIIAVDKIDIARAKEVYQGHDYQETSLRPYEPKVLVHSTPASNYEKILDSGCLKSWNILKANQEITENKPIGHLLGDPHDISDFVMLGRGVACEIVVASKQKGEIIKDINAPYQPGVRFYFDVEKLASDGLLVRDGAHYKVRDYLPLDKYLLFVASSKELNKYNGEKPFTPQSFSLLADKIFREKFQ